MWNSYWNWDPRETSMKCSHIRRRSLGAPSRSRRRAALGSAYALVAAVTVPFLVFAVPRMYASLHPDTVINTRGKVEMSTDIKTVFFLSQILFTWVFFWMWSLDRKVSGLERLKLQEASA
jgi:heme exporter protein C